MKHLLLLSVVALLLASATADLYMHNPRGSNDRNRERNQQRNNANRLFNSQNNAQGGYPWPGDATVRAQANAPTFYVGSMLQLEWTNQHSCSPGAMGNVQCTLIVQYACDNPVGTTTPNPNYPFPMMGLRDGWPDSDTVDASDTNNAGYTKREFTTTSGQNTDGTTRISANQFQGSATTRAARTNYYYNAVSGNPGVEYGMHEGIDWYDMCRQTSRNFGLYHSDQNPQGSSALFTRQNNNGDQHGLECPEEKEYYPYWRPYVMDANTFDNQGLPLSGVAAAWYDIAVFTNDTANCDFFQSNSQNCRGYGQCLCDSKCLTKANIAGGTLIPWDELTCVLSGGSWVNVLGDSVNANSTTGWGPGLLNGALADGTGTCKPDCLLHPMTRDNHLGNTLAVDSATGTLLPPSSGQPETANYQWTIPQRIANMRCVVRMRYNMSSNDFADHSYLPSSGLYTPIASTKVAQEIGWDSSYDCNGQFAPNQLTGKTPDSTTPLSKYHCYTVYGNVGPSNLPTKAIYNRPYVPVFTGNAALAVAANTNQFARTFQDRSYVFNVGVRPSAISPSAKIINLNARGRRGNIVQAYPAVEYDFVPNVLSVTDQDFVHYQTWGSDFNNALNANDGEGWQFSDRFNMVQIDNKGSVQPALASNMNMVQQLDGNFKSTGSVDMARSIRFALLDQTNCGTFSDNNNNGNGNDQNAHSNCGKLNSASPLWPPNPADGLMNFVGGTYFYTCTRNMNFSNRSQKGVIMVASTSSSSNAGVIAGAVIGSLAGVGLIAAGVLFYGKRHPNSRAGDAYKKCVACSPEKCKGGSSSNVVYGAGSTAGGGDMEYVRH